jgi:hypothetical protein
VYVGWWVAGADQLTTDTPPAGGPGMPAGGGGAGGGAAAAAANAARAEGSQRAGPPQPPGRKTQKAKSIRIRPVSGGPSSVPWGSDLIR